MLYIFWVETGRIITLKVDIAVDTVNNLKSVLAQTTGIADYNQVLLINGGESLRDGSRVAKYQSGTDTNPIFLFNRDAIESDRAPEPSVDTSSQVPDELDAKESVEAVLNLPPNFNSIVSRTQLAQQYHEFAKDLNKQCSLLVQEQHLQHQGWQAVMANLDDVISAFKKRLEKFQATFQAYLGIRGEKLQHLMSFNENIEILSKLPLFQSLNPVFQTMKEAETKENDQTTLDDESLSSEEVTILDWISAKDAEHSLQSVAEGCKRTMETFDDSTLEEVIKESRTVIDFCDNSQMREIKGLAERLFGLDQLLSEANKLVLEQKKTADLLYRMQQQAGQGSSGREPQPQLFKDMAATFEQLLHQMLKCHKKLFDIKRRCLAAKQELCNHLLVRLKWVISVENGITEVDDKIKIYYENIKRIRRLTHMLDQVRDSPPVYVSAVREVLRRRHYAADFTQWAKSVSETANKAFSSETELRKAFLLLHGSHFLLALFPGLDQFPPQFATAPPDPFDASLPPMTEDDLKQLLDRVPNLPSESLPRDTLVPCSFSCQFVGKDLPSPVEHPADPDRRRPSSHVDYDIVLRDPSCSCTVTERHLLDDRLPRFISSIRAILLQTANQRLREDLVHVISATRKIIEDGFADAVESVRVYSENRDHLHRDEMKISEQRADELAGRLREASEMEADTRRCLLEAEEQWRSCQEQNRLLEEMLEKERLDSQKLRGIQDGHDNAALAAADLLNSQLTERTHALDAVQQCLAEKEEQHRLIVEKLTSLEESLVVRQEESNTLIAMKDQEIKYIRVALEEARLCLQESQLSKENELLAVKEESRIQLDNENNQLRTELQSVHEQNVKNLLISEQAIWEENHRIKLSGALREKDLEMERQLAVLKVQLEHEFSQRQQPSRATSTERRRGERSSSANSGILSPPPDSSLHFPPLESSSQSVSSLARSDSFKSVLQENELPRGAFAMDMSYMATSQAPHSDPPLINPRTRNLSSTSQIGVTLSSCNMGDLVLFTYNKEFKQYTAYLPFKRSLYLLHSDSHVDLAISVPDHDGALLEVRSCVVAEIVGKEYVLTKKVPNRYRLQVGTKFYRVKAKAWDLDSVLKDAGVSSSMARPSGGSGNVSSSSLTDTPSAT